MTNLSSHTADALAGILVGSSMKFDIVPLKTYSCHVWHKDIVCLQPTFIACVAK